MKATSRPELSLFASFVSAARLLFSHSQFLPQSTLKRNRIRSELADTFPELLNRHSFLVEIEAEKLLVVNVRLLCDVQRSSIR